MTARRVPAAWVLLGLLVLAVAGSVVLRNPGRIPWSDGASAVPASAPDRSMWVATEDGVVVRIDPAGQPAQTIAASAFAHIYAQGATQLGWDARRGLLWYSDTHAGLRSLDLATGEPGPSIVGFADAALVGCATVSDGRPFAIDVGRRRIYVPVGTGGMLVYDADNLALVSTVPATAIEGESGLLPPVAVDPSSGAIWYAARNGSIVEIDTRSMRPTGRRIAYGASPHDIRALTAGSGALNVLSVDGHVRTIDLRTLTTRAETRPLEAQTLVGIAAP